MSQKLKLARQVLTGLKSSKGFDRVYETVSVVAASDGQCTLQWRVDDSLLNTQGTMHGGLITSVIDTATTTVLRSMGRKVPGVSVELSVSFIGAAKLNDMLTIDAVCKKLGKSLAFTEATVTNQDGKTIATGKHTKFVAESLYPNATQAS